MNYRRHNAFSKICQITGKGIGEFKLILPGDRIVVGVSGGKDSLTLMHVLTRLQQRAPIAFEFVGVTIDMGFEAFDGAGLERYCAAQGWPFERVVFGGRQILEDKAAGTRPCSLCARLRRGQLYAAADRLGCNVIALGQHLDDLCASLLMALWRGNGLKTMGPHVRADHGRKRLIRPLCLVPEAIIIEAAAEFRFPDFGSCDYLPEITAKGDRAFVERLITQLESQFPAIRHTMLESMRRVCAEHLLDPRFLTLPPEPETAAADDDDGPADSAAGEEEEN